jgi:hypothetical protein
VLWWLRIHSPARSPILLNQKSTDNFFRHKPIDFIVNQCYSSPILLYRTCSVGTGFCVVTVTLVPLNRQNLCGRGEQAFSVKETVMKDKISPGIAIIIIVAVLGAIFGVMWYQSEAPKLNRLPQPLPTAAPAEGTKTAPPANPTSRSQPQKNSPPNTEKPSAATSNKGAK